MNEKRQILLLKALKNGRISISMANKLYSGNKGKDALISLEYQDYLIHKGFGNFVPNTDANFPEEVVDRYKRWAESVDDEKKGGSEYDKVPAQ